MQKFMNYHWISLTCQNKNNQNRCAHDRQTSLAFCSFNLSLLWDNLFALKNYLIDCILINKIFDYYFLV